MVIWFTLQNRMASVDAGQYSLSTEEGFEFECSQCKIDDVVREANYFCPECSEYFCSSCESSLHGRLKVTKFHKLLPTGESTKAVAQNTATLPIMKCGCNLDRSVEFVCIEHKCSVCCECNNITHRKCRTVSIAEKCKYFTESQLTSSIEKTKHVEYKAVCLQALHSEQDKKFELEKSRCKEEINRIKDQLITFIETLAKKTVDELEALPFAHAKEYEISLSACNSVVAKLKADNKLLKGAQATGDSIQMFVASYSVTNSFEIYNNLLEEVQSQMKSTALSFKPDTTLVDIQNKVKTLGNIEATTHYVGRQFCPESFLSVKVKGEIFNITPAGAKRMTVLTFMPNGDLLICDFERKLLTVLNEKFDITTTLALPDGPWDAAVLNEAEIVVTSPDTKKLQKIALMPEWKVGSSISLQKKCFDVKTVGAKLVVLCTNDPGEGEIRVLDFDGNVQRRLGLNDDGTYLLSQPLHMTVTCNSDEDRVYVSDLVANTIVCMSLEGQLLSKLKCPHIRNPRGILLDRDNNYFVCGANDVYSMRADGTSCRKLLTREDGIEKPYCLNYRDKDETLIVTCAGKLLAFKLEKQKLETNTTSNDSDCLQLSS